MRCGLLLVLVIVTLSSSVAVPQNPPQMDNTFHQTYDTPYQTYDSSQQTYANPPETYVNHQQTYANPHEMYASPHESYASPHESYDNPHKTYDTAPLGSNPQEPKEIYDTTYDNYDLDSILNDPMKLERFSGCFLDKNECDPIPAIFKKKLKMTLSQACATCSYAKKRLIIKYITFLGMRRPKDLVELLDKYDPERIYYDSFLEALFMIE